VQFELDMTIGPKVMPPDLSRKLLLLVVLACPAASDLELLHPTIPTFLQAGGSCGG
jgi:hypothetical protein